MKPWKQTIGKQAMLHFLNVLAAARIVLTTARLTNQAVHDLEQAAHRRIVMDTFNKHMVGVQGDNIIIMMPPRGPMSKKDALVFAAWIVTLADDYEGGFEKALEAVRS